MPTLREAEASLSYVQCFLYLVSCSINGSIFHITWLDTFWIELILPFVFFILDLFGLFLCLVVIVKIRETHHCLRLTMLRESPYCVFIL